MASYNLTYGKKGQLEFHDEDELFFTVGYLTKTDVFMLKWEHNEQQGAWGSEGRIHVLQVPSNYPASLKNSHTKGVGSVQFRINCNAFLELLQDLGFVRNTASQNVQTIRSNIPSIYQASFDKGCNA